MTEPTNNQVDETNPTPAPRRFRSRFWGTLAVTVMVAGLVGFFAQSAMSSEWGWRGHGRTLDPAQVEERVEKMVAHLAIEIDATEEQEAQLTTIFTGAADELLALRERAGDGRETAKELADLLTGPTVDPAAVEAFRVEKLSLADDASQIVATALISAAEIMTPEQRAEIGDKIEFFTKMRHR